MMEKSVCLKICTVSNSMRTAAVFTSSLRFMMLIVKLRLMISSELATGFVLRSSVWLSRYFRKRDTSGCDLDSAKSKTQISSK